MKLGLEPNESETKHGQLSSIKANDSSNPLLDCWGYLF
jgi:hypothetical protein